jgi:hypothetical protein
VRRRISDSEWASILDIPAFFFKQLLSGDRRSIIEDTSFVPLGVVLQLLESFKNLSDKGHSHEITPSKKARLEYEFSTLPSESNMRVGETVVRNGETVNSDSRNTKATKNDVAEVPVYLWNEAIVQDGDPKRLSALDVLRLFALR